MENPVHNEKLVSGNDFMSHSKSFSIVRAKQQVRKLSGGKKKGGREKEEIIFQTKVNLFQ